MVFGYLIYLVAAIRCLSRMASKKTGFMAPIMAVISKLQKPFIQTIKFQNWLMIEKPIGTFAMLWFMELFILFMLCESVRAEKERHSIKFIASPNPKWVYFIYTAKWLMQIWSLAIKSEAHFTKFLLFCILSWSCVFLLMLQSEREREKKNDFFVFHAVVVLSRKINKPIIHIH